MESVLVLFLMSILLIPNINAQFVPIGGGCGCQQLPVQNYQVANNCGCSRNNLQLTTLPNGIQLANNLQIAKSVANLPCGCVPNSVQYSNLQLGNGVLGNGLQLTNLPLSQNEMLALLGGGISTPNYQNIIQLSLQSLLNQLSNAPVSCGCQQGLATNLGNNLNLLGFSGGASNVPIGLQNQPCSVLNNLNGMPVTAQQEIVLNNAPCPCQSCQNSVQSFTIY